jgi:hypothetical protein
VRDPQKIISEFPIVSKVNETDVSCGTANTDENTSEIKSMEEEPSFSIINFKLVRSLVQERKLG